MTTHDQAFFRLGRARQHGHHIHHLHIAKDARSLLLHLVRIEGDFKPRIEAAELIVNPAPRCADPAVLLIGIAEVSAGLELRELFHRVRDVFLRDIVDDRLDFRIECRSLRR